MEDTFHYPGMAMNEELPNGKIDGQIILTDHSLRFQYQDKIVEFSLQNLIIRRGGSSGHIIFIEHPSHPGWTIYTEKKSILTHLKGFSHPELSRQVTHIHQTRMKLRGIILIVIIAILATFLVLLQLRNPIATFIAGNIPAQWEQSLGESVFEQYKAERIIMEDPQLQQSLESITNPLLDTISKERYRFHVYIVQDQTINAFALPGGYVILHTGLLTSAETPEEMLGVLAHEISHVTLQHGLRKMIDSLGFFLIIRAFFGDSGSLLSEMMEGGAFLLDQHFSRTFEKEADNSGFTYLVQANINPSGMIGFFQRMYEKSKEEGALSLNNALIFLSTHPSPDNRKQYLQNKWEKLNRRSGYLDLSRQFEIFQEQLRQKLSTEE